MNLAARRARSVALLALTLALVPAARAQDAAAPGATPATAAPQEVAPQAAAPQALTVTRESSLSLPFDAPTEAVELVIAHDLPGGATYLSGSASLNGAALPDPRVGPSGRLYWTLPAASRGVLRYRVSHAGPLGPLAQPGLLARLKRDRAQVLAGRVDEQDLAAARATPPVASENPGVIKLPLAGSVYRERDRITVAVEGPLGGDLDLRANGEAVPEAAIGKRASDAASGTERREYVGVKLAEGENVLAVGGETVKVYYAGRTARVEVTGVQLLADGSTPLRLKLRVLDARGFTTAQSFVTVRPSLEPLAPDANAQESGYQVRLEDGEGVLELRPQALPARLTLDVLFGDRVQREAFDVTPDPARVGIGHAGITFGLSPLKVEGWSAQGYYEGMVGEGKLYATASSRGLPKSENADPRVPSYGDASLETVPLQGADPIAFRYEHPAFSAQYRQGAAPIDVLPLGADFTALSATTRGDTRLSGFAAFVPQEQVAEVLTPDGTRLYRLARAPISPDSETVQVVTRERESGKELSRITLARAADYTLDPDGGVLTLTAPLSRLDAGLNPVTLEVGYRTTAPLSNRQFAWGAQVKTERDHFSAGAAVVQLGGKVTAGAKVAYADGTTRAAASAAYSGGAQLAAEVRAKFGGGAAHANARYQDEGYGGLGAFEPGLTLGAGMNYAFTDALSAQLDGAYHALSGAWGGSVTGIVKLASGPIVSSAGLRAGFGGDAGVTALGSLGLRAPSLGVDVAHAQPFGGAATTSIGASFALTPALTFTARDDVNWAQGQRPSLGLTGRLGGANFSVNYDLPGASGDGNRARFGADTAFALGDKLSAGLAASEIYDFTRGENEFGVSPSLRLNLPSFVAALGADFAVRAGQFKTVLKGGFSVGASDQLTLSADGLAELGGTPGARLGVSGAYRAGELNALGFLRYQNGSLAGDRAELTGEVQAELHRAGWGVRGALAGRELLSDSASFTLQPSLGATAYLTDFLGLGLGARALLQPATGTALYGLGLEGSLRVLPGAWATLGYNFAGFDGIGGAATRKGFYLRLDLTLDEQSGARK